MLTGNKILLSALITVFAATAISIVGMVILFANSEYSSSGIGSPAARAVTKDFTVSGFSRVNAGGVWEIEIVHADSFGCTLSAPEAVIGLAQPAVSGATLSLNGNTGADPRRWNVKARITMPALDGIESSGNSQISFSGFTAVKMKISASGTSRIKGLASSVEALDCIASQSSIVDLSGCRVRNAEFDATFAAKITIFMAGGNLRGKAGASSTITYLGEPEGIEIEASGSAKILKVKSE
jgi:hypothetical protein